MGWAGIPAVEGISVALENPHLVDNQVLSLGVQR